MITTIVFTTTRDIGERRVLIDGVCAVHYLYLLKKLPKLHFRPYHLVIFFSLQHFRNYCLQRKRLVAMVESLLVKFETPKMLQNLVFCS